MTRLIQSIACINLSRTDKRETDRQAYRQTNKVYTYQFLACLYKGINSGGGGGGAVTNVVKT